MTGSSQLITAEHLSAFKSELQTLANRFHEHLHPESCVCTVKLDQESVLRPSTPSFHYVILMFTLH